MENENPKMPKIVILFIQHKWPPVPISESTFGCLLSYTGHPVFYIPAKDADY